MYIEYYASDGSLMCLGDVNELYHYNHNHDALGRFAKSAGSVSSKKVSSPRQYKRKLNKMDQLSAVGKGRAMESEYKSKKLKSKGKNKESKLKKAQAKKYRDISKNLDSQKNKIVAEALTKKQYSVTTNEIKRNSRKRQDLLVSAGIIATTGRPIPALVAYNAGVRASNAKRYGSENPRSITGTKYKVRKTKPGKKPTYLSTYSVGNVGVTHVTEAPNAVPLKKRKKK